MICRFVLNALFIDGKISLIYHTKGLGLFLCLFHTQNKGKILIKPSKYRELVLEWIFPLRTAVFSQNVALRGYCQVASWLQTAKCLFTDYSVSAVELPRSKE